MMFPN